MSSGLGPSLPRRCQPAAAIIAALSVHIARLGRKPRTPSAAHAPSSSSRSSEFAATPPPSTMPSRRPSAAARRALATSTSTTAVWNDAATSADVDVGMLADVVDDRRLQAAEAEVEPVVEHRPREADRLGIAVQRGVVDRRPAGIAEVEEPRHLVERLAGGVVDRLAEQPVVAVPAHLDQHRVAARHQQHDERELERRDPRGTPSSSAPRGG